jgi:hypothetical protein
MLVEAFCDECPLFNLGVLLTGMLKTSFLYIFIRYTLELEFLLVVLEVLPGAAY